MVVVNYVCDRCGGSFCKEDFYRIDVRNSYTNTETDVLDKMDFCDECVQEIIHYAKMKPKGNDELEKKEKTINDLILEGHTDEEIIAIKGCKQNTIYQKRCMLGLMQKPPIDKGKIMALWKAKWTIHAIADDMGLTDDEVEDVVKEFRR